jgi:ABC-type Mn2+/Zn2+ transport system permease subunit
MLLTPREDILEALFGDISKISSLDAVLAVILSLVVLFIMRLISKGFILGTISKDLAKASGVRVAHENFIFMLLVAAIVALGIKSVGTLLMGALVIIPAIASKNITSSMNRYSWLSAFIGLISLVGGILFANYFHLAPGPIVVLTSTAIFLVTLAFKR